MLPPMSDSAVVPWETMIKVLTDTMTPGAPSWADWTGAFDQSGLRQAVSLRLQLMAGAGIVVFLATYLALLPRCGWRLRLGERQIDGRRLVLPPEGRTVAAQMLSREIGTDGSKLNLAPGVPLPSEYEVQGILLVGAPGSGKSQILEWLMAQWLARPVTRLVVLDAGKGDFISRWPDEDYYLLAPHDDRGLPGPHGTPQAMAWDIAGDVSGFQDAAELADRVIADSREPQWADGARLILQGVIVGLQKTLGRSWGWRELHDAVTMSDRNLHDWIETHFPEAKSYIALDEEGNANRTSGSYINSFRATVVKLTKPLSLAWGDVPASRRLSLRRWLLSGDQYGMARSIILGRSGQFAAMSAAWIGSVLRLMTSIVQSPVLNESRTRRVIFVLDELRTIAVKGDSIKALVEFGRSKGVGLVVGVQTLGQLREAWEADAANNFEEIMRTKIFGRVGTTSDARAGGRAIAENICGHGNFSRWRVKTNSSNGTAATTRYQEEVRRLVVEPDFFESGVGPHARGLRAALLLPEALCLLDWPYSDWEPVRPAIIPARWIDSLSTPERYELRIR